MPALSPTMEEGTLSKWLVKEGDEIRSGDVIAEIETDKATMEVEAVDEGVMAKILVPEGSENVKVNAVIAVIADEGEDVKSVSAPSGAPERKQVQKTAPKPDAKSEEHAKAEAVKSPDAAPEKSSSDERIFATPLARRIAKDKGIDLASISGSGPRGRIIKADVEGVKPGQKSSPPSASPQSSASAVDPRAFYESGSYEEVPLDNMRKTIARRLTQAMQEIPHFYLSIDCELGELLKVRKVLNEQAPEGVKLSVNDFLIRAAALALAKVPDANVSFAGNALLKHKHSDIGIAVAIEGGLITPIIRQAEAKGLAEISLEAKSLAERARNKKLKPQEFEGGSFSISNLGMFGIDNFTAVINPPQAAILAVGRGVERPVVKAGKLEVATMMTVTMSCDHRAIDGALGAQFLQAFKTYVEYPPSMLM
tara:strand:- start:81753 stop:83021 length:1269 start_codon:yes stop_codon:yes gene_type:complete